MEMKSIDPGKNLKFLAQQTIAQRPNLKNFRRGSNIVMVPLEIVFGFSRFEPALNRNRFLAVRVQRRGLISLNSAQNFV